MNKYSKYFHASFNHWQFAGIWQKINERILCNATKFRIVPYHSSFGNGYIGEAYVQTDVTPGKWMPIKGTFVLYHTELNNGEPCMLYAYNRCKKIILKMQHVKLNKLISESGYAACNYGSENGPSYTPEYSEDDAFEIPQI